jgi:hypothetical protein
LENTLGATVHSLRQVMESVGRFKTGDFSCQDHSGTGQSSSNRAEPLRNRPFITDRIAIIQIIPNRLVKVTFVYFGVGGHALALWAIFISIICHPEVAPKVQFSSFARLLLRTTGPVDPCNQNNH